MTAVVVGTAAAAVERTLATVLMSPRSTPLGGGGGRRTGAPSASTLLPALALSRRFVTWQLRAVVCVIVLAAALALPAPAAAAGVLAVYSGVQTVFAFSLYAADKWSATKSLWRVPERHLHAATWCFGALGALAAMLVCRHKVRCCC